jgi:DNA-binding NarL/FixJ family response regulator
MERRTMPVMKILIADDHTMFINGLRLLLSDTGKYDVVAVAYNGQEALNILAEQRIDIVLMDVNMPKLNGYQATFKIKEQYPGVKVIVLSMLADELSVNKMLEAGADGYLFKNADEEELFESLDAVLRGEIYITKEVRNRINVSKNKSNTSEARLSSREIDIANLIVNGLTNQEIADTLCLSVRTVETHRKNILAKLELKNTASLVKYLIDNKPFIDV